MEWCWYIIQLLFILFTIKVFRHSVPARQPFVNYVKYLKNFCVASLQNMNCRQDLKNRRYSNSSEYQWHMSVIQAMTWIPYILVPYSGYDLNTVKRGGFQVANTWWTFPVSFPVLNIGHVHDLKTELVCYSDPLCRLGKWDIGETSRTHTL